MTKAFSNTAVRSAVLALTVGLSACSMLDSILPADKVDYRNGARKTAGLEVPPDLTPLARDGRYAAATGSISASEMKRDGAKSQTGSTAGASVAVGQSGDVRIERAGSQRWLSSNRSPEALWPLVRQFWIDRGFKLEEDNAQAGLLQTDWAENRAKLPNDLIRSTLGRLVDGLYSTGERDKFRTRIERTASGGSEIYISHKGLEEVYVGRDRETGTTWTARPSDPGLETDMLTRLMVSLGSGSDAVRTAQGSDTSAAASGSSLPDRPAKARVLTGQAAATMQLDDGLERGWRRVGLALDRGGFTVEDRDRTSGLYSVRYVDPTEASKETPNFIMRFFGAKDPAETALARYRISVKADGASTRVSVLNTQGEPDNSANAQRIVKLLADELKY